MKEEETKLLQAITDNSVLCEDSSFDEANATEINLEAQSSTKMPDNSNSEVLVSKVCGHKCHCQKYLILNVLQPLSFWYVYLVES